MILNEVANIATIVEAIFVVVSVLFIWRELRENTKLNKAANTRSLVEITSPFNLQLIQDRQMAEYWVLGARKFTQMDEVDKFRYKSILTWWLILHENIYYQWKSNLLDTDIYSSWKHDLEIFIKEQNLWLHWDDMKGVYQPEFGFLVNQIIEKQRTRLNPDESSKNEDHRNSQQVNSK